MFEDGLHWQLPVCDYPVDGYDLYALYDGSDYRWSYMRRGAGLPDLLEIPTSSISGVYDPDREQFEDVAVQGSADYTEAGWFFDTDISSGRWYVQVNPYTHTIRRPVLPEALVAEWDLPLDDFRGKTLSGYDFSHISNLDGAMRSRFKTEPDVLPPFDRMFAFHSLYNGFAAKVPSAPPTADDLRASHYRCR